MLVVSDSHGNHEILRKILEKEGKDTQIFFHCGDSLANYEDMFPFATVRGNCDLFSRFQKHITMALPIGNVYVTHGEIGFENLIRIINQLKPKPHILLYGHTHIHRYEYINGCHCFNPGSVSLPRDGTEGTYLIVEGDSVDNIKWQFKSIKKL